MNKKYIFFSYIYILMERKKCSLKKHSEIEAISFCKQCKIYLCNKCHNMHPEVHDNHTLINYEKDKNEVFNDICKYDNHNKELEFFCKNHNTLCCVSCLCKIKIKDMANILNVIFVI